MASADLLQTFLHFHLATDTAAASNIPSVVSALSTANLESSPHLPKWTNRVNALIHSKDPSARWAGITLALITSRLSRNVLISSAQSWVSIVLPMLSRNECVAVWKASIRLLALIFISTTNLAEFQRHVVTPNVPKFSSALLCLAEKQTDEDFKVLCLDTVAMIVPLYPSLHRQMASALSALSLNFLNGSPTFTPAAIISSASRLHACLHTTGGKVGGATLWRKSIDETIAFCSDAVTALRTTYTAEGKSIPSHAYPLVSVPLNLDRLLCGTELLCNLLRAKVERPVAVPIHILVKLCIEALRVTKDGALSNDADPSIRSMEAAVVPNILEIGCSLTNCLARHFQSRIAPYLNRILGIVAHQLEQLTSGKERIPFIKLIPSLLGSGLPPHEPLICGRIIKTVLPSIAMLQSQKVLEEATSTVDVGSKRGKKRARGYEGDEVFKVGRSMLCESAEDTEVVLAALDALTYLLRVPNIPEYLQSLSSRLLLSLLLTSPKLPASSVAHDPTIKDEILRKVKSFCVEFASGSSAILCKNLPLVVDAIANDASDDVTIPRSSNQNALLLDLMLHPRLPPLLRSLPPLNTIVLSQSEEGVGERKTRESLRLHRLDDDGINVETNTEATKPPASRTVQETQESTESESNALQVRSPVDQPTPALPVVIPAVPLRQAAPLVVQPIVLTTVVPAPALQTVQSSTFTSVSHVESLVHEAERPGTPPAPGGKEEQVPALSQPTMQVGAQEITKEAPRPSELALMVVNDDDDDLEMPIIDPASPSGSEME